MNALHSTLAASLILSVALASCGRDIKHTVRDESDANKPVEATPADSLKSDSGAAPVFSASKEVATHVAHCENMVSFASAPKEWTEIEGKEMITGKKGEYELTHAQLHGEMITKDGKIASASGSTVVLDRKVDKHGAIQVVLCKDVENLKLLTLISKPFDTISRKDGSFSERRDIKFVVASESDELSAETYSVKEAMRFGQKTKEMKSTEEKLRKKGITFDSRVYQISAVEFELRLTTTAPSENGDGSVFTLTGAFRYLLAGAPRTSMPIPQPLK